MLSTLIASFSLAALVQGAGEQAPAKLTVRLPVGASLFIDDVLHSSSGESREVKTPPLEAGYKYRYTLLAELSRDGRPWQVAKKISFRAGETVAVDLSDLGDKGGWVEVKEKPGGELKPSKEEQELLDLTNQERAKAGLAALKPNAKLFKAARAHTANMAQQDRLDHTLDDKGPGERLADVGYVSAGWGENCAAGQRTPAEAISTWMNSPGHRGNILNAKYTEVGLGIASNAQGSRYFTQVFARPGGN